jgi:hypothetical protein
MIYQIDNYYGITKAMVRPTTHNWNRGSSSDIGELTPRPFLAKIPAFLANQAGRFVAVIALWLTIIFRFLK